MSRSPALIAPFLQRPAAAAVLTDFDGTLSAVVDDPAQAGPVPGALAVLARLAQRFAVVGVISGRPVRFLLDALGGISGLHLAGLYGIEQAIDGSIRTDPGALQWAEAVEAAAAEAEASAPPGVRVERKGLAVTLHVRSAPGQAGWIAAFGDRQASARNLEAHRGRQSLELRPPVAIDKGTVVEGLASGCAAVCYCGDDAGDLPAFGALARLRRRGAATLAVAALSAESPPELARAADLTVDGPQGMVEFLAQLAWQRP